LNDTIAHYEIIKRREKIYVNLFNWWNL
jgi:hypothetical protein